MSMTDELTIAVFFIQHGFRNNIKSHNYKPGYRLIFGFFVVILKSDYCLGGIIDGDKRSTRKITRR